MDKDRALVVHLVHRFECGGLQTLLAECINRMPVQRYRHAVVSLTAHTDYVRTITRPDVELHALHKQPGSSLGTHFRLWKLLRQLQPALMHTYNVGTIEYAATALLAGVRVRVHAEHGRDSVEIDGRHARYNVLRRLLAPVIHAYVPVSADLVEWLRDTVGIPKYKIAMVPNGVDTLRYVPLPDRSQHDQPFATGPVWIGTVGRIDRIKDHMGLLDAFQRLLARFPAPEHDLRLAIVGAGPLLPALRDRVLAAGLSDRVWLPGARTDIDSILRGWSIFVLPSLSEATPVTILEAMASGLPVVATQVGGVPELVQESQTGLLTAPAQPQALADALAVYVSDPGMGKRHGMAGRAFVEARYSIDAMVRGYDDLYSRHLPRLGADR